MTLGSSTEAHSLRNMVGMLGPKYSLVLRMTASNLRSSRYSGVNLSCRNQDQQKRHTSYKHTASTFKKVCVVLIERERHGEREGKETRGEERERGEKKGVGKQREGQGEERRDLSTVLASDSF